GLGHPPLAAFFDAAGNTHDGAAGKGIGGAGEVADLDIDPGDGGAPRGPEGGGERGARGNAQPTLAGVLKAGGKVRVALAVEIAGNDIDPSNARAPSIP